MSYYIPRFFIFSFLISFLLIIFTSHTIIGKQHISSKSNTEWGVRSTTIKTDSGNLTVNMPDDAALGDTISGTVVAEPAGETQQEQQANMDTLEGYVFDTPEVPSKVVETEPEETPTGKPASKKVITMEIPAAITGEIIDLVLRDPKGNEVTELDVPVSPPSTYTPPAAPKQGDYNLPEIGQAGRPIEMTGPFEGEIINTEVTIGGKKAKVVAQSPRKTVAETPRDVIGPTNIELRQGYVTVKDQYRSIALRLSADKLTLMKGERTRLNIQIMGLQGLNEPIPFRLVNQSPEVVSMEGGDTQIVNVSPEVVGSEGVYTISKILTGIQPGPFSISARISPEYMNVPMPTTIADERDKGDKCECKRMEVKLGKKSETKRFQEKLKDGNTKILIQIPYQFKTRCSKGDMTEECKAEIKVGAQWKGDKGPKPLSEEIYDDQGKKVTYFQKPTKGAKVENIDCGRKCPEKLSWSDLKVGILYYEALFGKLGKELTEKVNITLTPEKCKGGKKSMTYEVNSCECNNIALVFPGMKLAGLGEYSLDITKGFFQRWKSGVQLIIPYIYNTACKGFHRALCNAAVEVDAEALNWKVHTVKKEGNTTKFREEQLNMANIKVNKPEMITCTGKCSRKGEPNRWNPNDVRQLKINIEVPERNIKKGEVERHTGEIKLSFRPKYCDNVEIRDKAGKGGEVIDTVSYKVDIKSNKWKKLHKR